MAFSLNIYGSGKSRRHRFWLAAPLETLAVAMSLCKGSQLTRLESLGSAD